MTNLESPRRSLDLASRFASWAEDGLQPFGPLVVMVTGVLFYLVGLAWAWQHTSYDVWGAVLLAPLLILLTIPLARRATRDERDSGIARLILGGIVIKLLMTLVRYAVAFGLYGGSADAGVYHTFGKEAARHFRQGDFQTFGESLTSTGFIRIFTGIVYTLIGPSKLGGFLAFSWLGFWGLFLFYRAFRIAVPNGNHRRYAILVFFLPSMLFWPSSIGKEAWMSLALGVAAYGAARILTSRRWGFVIFGLGTWAAATVRPHVGLIAFVAISVAYLLRRPNASRRRLLGPLPKMAAAIVLVVIGALLASKVQEFFGVENLESGGVDSALAITVHRTELGGSSFTAVKPTTPLRFGWACVTVLFRPFPWEANNFQSLLASAEGMLVLGLSGLAAFRVALALRRPWKSPYVALSVVYILLFCYAFASIGNFGILTRQRVQVLPFLLVLLCLPATPTLDAPTARARA